jgi:hypothetical protein
VILHGVDAIEAEVEEEVEQRADVAIRVQDDLRRARLLKLSTMCAHAGASTASAVEGENIGPFVAAMSS